MHSLDEELKNAEDERSFKIAKIVFNSTGFDLEWDKERDKIIAKKNGKKFEIGFNLIR